jgi:hypothetical protein
MSLKGRVDKLEASIEPKQQLHIICGPEETLDAQVKDFREQNPHFEDMLLVVTDCYKPENAGS